MACDEAVIIAAILIFLEFIYRWYNVEDSTADTYIKDIIYNDFKNHIYVVFYIISICSTVLYVKGLKSPSIPRFLEPYIPLLYLFDSVSAIGLGISLYYEIRILMIVSMIFLTNFFLLHILHTLFSKKGGELVSKKDMFLCHFMFYCIFMVITFFRL